MEPVMQMFSQQPVLLNTRFKQSVKNTLFWIISVQNVEELIHISAVRSYCKFK